MERTEVRERRRKEEGVKGMAGGREIEMEVDRRIGGKDALIKGWREGWRELDTKKGGGKEGGTEGRRETRYLAAGVELLAGQRPPNDSVINITTSRR